MRATLWPRSRTGQTRGDDGVPAGRRGGAERAVWIEVHKAETSEVTPVLAKLQRLRDRWAHEGDDLRRMTERNDAGERYLWIATGKIRIPRNSPQRRRLSANGLKPVQRLSLD